MKLSKVYLPSSAFPSLLMTSRDAARDRPSYMGHVLSYSQAASLSLLTSFHSTMQNPSQRHDGVQQSFKINDSSSANLIDTGIHAKAH